jgi:hypothetical protein
MNIQGEIKNIILDKFEKGIESEFDEMETMGNQKQLGVA